MASEAIKPSLCTTKRICVMNPRVFFISTKCEIKPNKRLPVHKNFHVKCTIKDFRSVNSVQRELCSGVIDIIDLKKFCHDVLINTSIEVGDCFTQWAEKLFKKLLTFELCRPVTK